MSSLDSFLRHVRPWAPGVSDQTAYTAIRNAAIEFCERTRLWKYESTIAVLSTDLATRPITVPADSAVHDFEVTLWDGKEIDPKATADLDDEMPGWRTGLIGAGRPQFITQIEQDTLKLVPAPAQDGSLYLCLRLKPSQNAQALPDFLNEYSECLGWGALGRILTVPGQSYSNPELAMFYTTRFTTKVDALSTKGSKGQQNARKRTRASFY